MVACIQWSPDGKDIAIVYADGAVIVGTVEGTRKWGKELDFELLSVVWSPDNK